MPAWKDYKSEARSRGALAFELYAVYSVPAGAPEDVRASLPDHLAYQGKLEVEGKLFLAGPQSDESGELMEGIGLVIYRAGSFEEAHALAEADPMHMSGARRFTLRRWLVNEGSMSISLKLSGQTVTLK